MRPIIEFCATNLANGCQKVFEALERDPDLDIVEYGCLSFCGKCSASLFALVNGKVVIGKTSEELTKNIYTFIENNLDF